MTDEDILTIKGIGSTMAGSFPLFLITLQKERATAISHILTVTIQIRSVDSLTTPHGHAIVTLGTTTAVIP
jgi:hypothetical protein